MNQESAAFLPSALVVNIQEIDDQHAALFSRLAALKELCLNTTDLPLAEAEALMNQLREHCATEERLAGANGLNFSAHARKHQMMLKSIAKAIDEVHHQKIDVFGVLRYIEYWFERHIREEDLNLGRDLQQVSSSLYDPEKPFTLARAAAA